MEADRITLARLGLAAFAAIVLTDGTEDLSWIRFAIAAVVFLAVTLGSALAIRYWYDA